MFFRQSYIFVHVECYNILEETIPFLFRSIKALYIPRGDDPVGQPNTKGFSGVGLAAFILAAT